MKKSHMQNNSGDDKVTTDMRSCGPGPRSRKKTKIVKQELCVICTSPATTEDVDVGHINVILKDCFGLPPFQKHPRLQRQLQFCKFHSYIVQEYFDLLDKLREIKERLTTDLVSSLNLKQSLQQNDTFGDLVRQVAKSTLLSVKVNLGAIDYDSKATTAHQLLPSSTFDDPFIQGGEWNDVVEVKQEPLDEDYYEDKMPEIIEPDCLFGVSDEDDSDLQLNPAAKFNSVLEPLTGFDADNSGSGFHSEESDSEQEAKEDDSDKDFNLSEASDTDNEFIPGQNNSNKRKSASKTSSRRKRNYSYKCRLCSTSFSSKDDKILHLQTIHDLNCKLCSKVFQKWKDLKKHRLLVHPSNRPLSHVMVECKHCGKSVKELGLVTHIALTHEKRDSKQNKCTFCDKVYQKRRSLKHHLATRHLHTHQKVICDECGKVLSSTGALQTHKKLLHQNTAFKFFCPKCGMGRINQSTLDIHVFSCKGKREKLSSWKCSYCEKDFKKKVSLQKHLANIHLKTEVKKYNCQFCPKIFSNNSSLIVHLRKNHMDQFQSKCDVCNELQLDDKMLQNHKTFMCLSKNQGLGLGKTLKLSCDTCGKVFTSERLQQEHTLRMHTNIRPFSCDLCSKSFPFARTLKYHKRLVHERKNQASQKSTINTECVL